MALPPEVLTRSMNNMKYQQVRGVNYLTSGFVIDVAEHLKRIHGLQLRDDDVFCVGFPRTGNHLMYELVQMILRQDTKFTEKRFYTTLLELMGEDIAEKMRKMASPRYLATHHRIHQLPHQVVEKKIRVIYLMRNPKDVLLSLFRLLSHLKDNAQRYCGTWDEFFELQMAEKFPWGTWFDHILAMDSFLKDHQDCPVYIFSFEKMKADPVTVVKELCSFLGKPDDLAPEMATIIEFANMKKVLREGKMKPEEDLLDEGSDALFRKGEVGNWKEKFSVAQSERFDRAFREKMTRSELAKLVEEYL